MLFINLLVFIHCNFTQKRLEDTSKLLVIAKDDVKRTQYALKEKDFIISEQRKAGELNYILKETISLC